MNHNVEVGVAGQHAFSRPEGTEVQSAKLGRTRAFIWQDPEPASIWRGEPKRIVGHMPVCFWRYVVSGEMSSMALTEAGAKANAERRAWHSDANYRTSRHRVTCGHQLSPEVEQAEREALQSVLDEVGRMFPIDPAHYRADEDEPDRPSATP